MFIYSASANRSRLMPRVHLVPGVSCIVALKVSRVKTVYSMDVQYRLMLLTKEGKECKGVGTGIFKVQRFPHFYTKSNSASYKGVYVCMSSPRVYTQVSASMGCRRGLEDRDTHELTLICIRATQNS
jgi:hypothetical protein